MWFAHGTMQPSIFGPGSLCAVLAYRPYLRTPSLVESDDVIVDLPRNMDDFVAPVMAQRDSQDTRVFLVVGGGAAGVAAADALRQEGYTGRIVLITEERHLPYDRPVLSKNLGKASDPGSLSLRDQEYFDKHEIEIRRSTKVEKLDAATKTLRLQAGRPYTTTPLLWQQVRGLESFQSRVLTSQEFLGYELRKMLSALLPPALPTRRLLLGYAWLAWLLM